MPEAVKVPKRIEDIVKACREGQTLHHCNVVLKAGVSEPTYWLEPSGRPVGPKSARAAIEMGLLGPLRDGLFDALDSQSFKAG